MTTCKDYSIGEVAKKLNLPVHTIRFWTQEFEHIEFIKRNGRRYYDDMAITELQKIKELAHKKGIKIDGIKKMLRYNKIDIQKLDEAEQQAKNEKLECAICKIDKIIRLLEK